MSSVEDDVFDGMQGRAGTSGEREAAEERGKAKLSGAGKTTLPSVPELPSTAEWVRDTDVATRSNPDEMRKRSDNLRRFDDTFDPYNKERQALTDSTKRWFDAQKQHAKALQARNDTRLPGVSQADRQAAEAEFNAATRTVAGREIELAKTFDKVHRAFIQVSMAQDTWRKGNLFGKVATSLRDRFGLSLRDKKDGREADVRRTVETGRKQMAHARTFYDKLQRSAERQLGDLNEIERRSPSIIASDLSSMTFGGGEPPPNPLSPRSPSPELSMQNAVFVDPRVSRHGEDLNLANFSSRHPSGLLSPIEGEDLSAPSRLRSPDQASLQGSRDSRSSMSSLDLEEATILTARRVNVSDLPPPGTRGAQHPKLGRLEGVQGESAKELAQQGVTAGKLSDYVRQASRSYPPPPPTPPLSRRDLSEPESSSRLMPSPPQPQTRGPRPPPSNQAQVAPRRVDSPRPPSPTPSEVSTQSQTSTLSRSSSSRSRGR